MNKNKLFHIIFDPETKSGKTVDIIISLIIVISILAVMFESVPRYEDKYGTFFIILEWVITFLFTVEYVSRIYLEKEPVNYIFSLFGIIDLLTIIPTFLSIFIAGAQGFMVIRALRLLRVFRILKLNKNSNKGKIILEGIKSSKDKIIIFIYALAMLITILGTILYLIEGRSHGFASIPASIYWTISKLTVMDGGGIEPITALGKSIDSFIKILAHSVIAIPTGIVTATILNSLRTSANPLICSRCERTTHDSDSTYCKDCGSKLINSSDENLDDILKMESSDNP